MRTRFLIFGLLLALSFSCQKDDISTEPNLIIKFKFDSNQVRLNNLGQPVTIPSGNAAQSPSFNSISAHFLN